MNKQILTLSIFFLAITGCEDNKTDDNPSENQVITHDIDAVGASGFY